MSDPVVRIFLCGLLKGEQWLASCRGPTVGGFYTAQIFNEGNFSVGSNGLLAEYWHGTWLNSRVPDSDCPGDTDTPVYLEPQDYPRHSSQIKMAR